ncbi:MAG: Ig-like domain repeat protein [Frankiaceae bacterium]|nr:Ig-like domain repeat protein [Frankiaceae bacterium]MBV9872291.1 Ig-like domain repeat protein [Frankiaceae bacterium]
MKLTIRRAALSAAAVAVAGSALLVTGSTAHATTTPPWEPDSSSSGGLLFYNSSGTQITGGNISDGPIAAYVQGTTTIRQGDTKATLYGYLPVSGQVPGQWSGEAMSASTVYPNSSAPGALGTSTLPLVTGASDDESVATLAADYPNNSTTDGYKGVYQLRLKTTAAGQQPNVTYDSADILITGTTWSVLYSQSPATPTTTALAVSTPAAFHGDDVGLQATVTPSAATGTVQFKDSGTVIATSPVSGGVATTVTSDLSDGTHTLTATFVPDSGAYKGSTSPAKHVTVSPHPTKTKLKASSKTVKAGKKLTLTAKVAPKSAAGKVTFLDGKSKLAKVKVKHGKAVLKTKLSKGKHKLVAKFKPKHADDFAASTSKKVKVKVKA